MGTRVVHTLCAWLILLKPNETDDPRDELKYRIVCLDVRGICMLAAHLPRPHGVRSQARRAVKRAATRLIHLRSPLYAPGIIHNHTGGMHHVEAVHAMVRRQLEPQHHIIVMTLSATQDQETQVGVY